MVAPDRHVRVLGTRLSLCDRDHLLGEIERSIAAKRKIVALSGNVHAFNLCCRHDWLRAYYNAADFVRLDGAGVRLGCRVLGHQPPPRMTWADFAWDLAAYAEPRGFTSFLLGARPGVAEKAATQLRIRFPHLCVVGIHHGYFDKTPGCAENEAVIEQINAVGPDILIVGFGMPLQERWLMENWERIDAHVALTGGAVFDYISGELRRAPWWMTDHGLEWLGRLIIEPGRLWRRYLIGNPLFILRVLRQRIAGARSDHVSESKRQPSLGSARDDQP